MSHILQNTEVTGDVAALGFTHVTTPPLIESICPLPPRVRVTLFPTLESQLLKVRVSENCPVMALYDTHPVDERLVRLILLLKVLKSSIERAPVVVVLASLRLMDVPAA